MCSSCKSYSGCDCVGGSVFAYCPAEKGFYCSVCKHEGGTNLTTNPNILDELLSPELLELVRKAGKEYRKTD